MAMAGAHPIPNYFVSIQIINQEIQRNIGEIQEHVLRQEPRLKSAAKSLPTLHFSLMMLKLPKDNLPMQSIQEAMNNCREMAVNQTIVPLSLNVEGMGNFGNNVVFAELSPGPSRDRLLKLAEIVANSFGARGMESTETRPFHPHLTLFHLKDKLKQRLGINAINPALYKQYSNATMGVEEVTKLQLCAVIGRMDANGYYEVIHEVKLR